MKISEARYKANRRYDAKAYYRPALRIPVALEEQLKQKAAEHGSINDYILTLIKKDLGIKEGNEE